MHSFVRGLVLALLAVTVSAHFQLQFPPPRGVFVEDDEPNFCDGYTSPATNRTQFPLGGGFFSLNSEHPQWTAGVNATTSANATTFADFSSPIVSFFQLNGEGAFCVPMDFSKSSTFQAGQNVTIQVVFNGGDGNLYQCADLTLSSRTDLLSGVSCSNATSSTGSATGTSTSPPASSSTTAASSSALPMNALSLFSSALFGLTIVLLVTL